MSLTRRDLGRAAALFGGGLLGGGLLAGCGFHPLYASGAQDAALGRIFVDIIPDRSGQVLRQALQQQLEGADSSISKIFVLGVGLSLRFEGIGIQDDNSSSRTRVTGRATWNLRRVGTGMPQLTGGVVSTLDGFNVIDEQYFYSDLAQEATQRRVAEALAAQIVLALGVYFHAHPVA